MSIDLTMRHMRAVAAIADTGGFTAAAETLQVGQSALSRTLQEMERRLGVTLFARTTRRVEPTLEGQEFIAIARRLVGEFDAAMNHFEGYLEGTRGAVSIAALPSLAATLLPPVLARYREERPEVTVSVRDGFSDDVLEMVDAGEVDFALTVGDVLPPHLTVRHVARDEFRCVLPPGHALADQELVSWADLRGEPFVAFDRSSSIRRYADRAVEGQRVELGPVTQARNIGAVAGLVASGLGVNAAPGLVVPLMQFADVVVRPLEGPRLEREICVIRDPRRPLAGAALGLVQLLLGAAGRGIDLPSGVRWIAAGDSAS